MRSTEKCTYSDHQMAIVIIAFLEDNEIVACCAAQHGGLLQSKIITILSKEIAKLTIIMQSLKAIVIKVLLRIDMPFSEKYT